jgi:hypothetical protein
MSSHQHGKASPLFKILCCSRTHTQADPNDPKTRERVEMFLAEPDKIDGLDNTEAKCFK